MSGGPLLLAVGIRQIHRKVKLPEIRASVCAECRQAWPCSTEEAIRSWERIPASIWVEQEPKPKTSTGSQ